MSPLPPPRPDKVVILGKSGSGKSSLAKALVRSIPRVLIFDPLDEYGAPHAIRDASPKELYAYIKTRRRFCVSYVPGKDLEREFEFTCWIAYVVGNLTFVADELDQCCTSAWSGPRFGKLLRRGRHQGVGLVSISRRPTEIPKDVTANSYRMIVFKSDENRDLVYYRQRFGAHAAMIPQLPVLTGLEWSDAAEERRLVVVDPARKTVAYRPVGSHLAASGSLDV